MGSPSLRPVAKRLVAALFSRSNLLPLLAALIYLTNRLVFPLDSVLPYEFANYHLGDLCGGVIFPAYVNVLGQAVSGKDIVVGLRSSLFYSALGSICWEIVTPFVFHYGTADPIDALMYFLGGLAYLALYRPQPKPRPHDKKGVPKARDTLS